MSAVKKDLNDVKAHEDASHDTVNNTVNTISCYVMFRRVLTQFKDIHLI